MIVEEENSKIKQLNEMFVNVLPSLPINIENSIYYAKLRNLMHGEIINYCKEQMELRDDLNFLRLNIGQELSEDSIRKYLDGLKDKYNGVDNNVALDYHIEITRVDYGVPVFVIIKRSSIYMKKFVYRFRKSSSEGIESLSNAGINEGSIISTKEERKKKYTDFTGGII